MNAKCQKTFQDPIVRVLGTKQIRGNYYFGQASATIYGLFVKIFNFMSPFLVESGIQFLTLKDRDLSIISFFLQIKMLMLFLLSFMKFSFGESEDQLLSVCPDGWLDETLYGLGCKIHT